MAARNVVLAEQMGVDITLICNGCYKSIWEVNHKLKHNDELRDGVNEVLKEIDMGSRELSTSGTSPAYTIEIVGLKARRQRHTP